jgi:hypothetical protein
MQHFLTIRSITDILNAKSLFALYDVVNLYRANHPIHTHVMQTNTWCAKRNKYDASIPNIDEEVAERMLKLAETKVVDAHEDINLFPDDELCELAYNEFWSTEHNGSIHGVTKGGEYVPYYNPNKGIGDVVDNVDTTMSTQKSRSILALLKPAKRTPKKTSKPKSLVVWDE